MLSTGTAPGEGGQVLGDLSFGWDAPRDVISVGMRR